jgi:hypothetical protein
MRPVDVIRRHTVCVISPRAGQSAIANAWALPAADRGTLATVGSIVVRLAAARDDVT